MIRRRLATLLSALAVTSAVGCTPAVDQVPGAARVAVLVSATTTEPAPVLPASVRLQLEATAVDRRWERDPTAGLALVATAGDPAPAAFPLVPRRADGSVERGLQRDRLVDANVDAVAAAVAGAAGDEPGLDLLDAIARITRSADGGLLVVLSHGLTTAGGFDLRAVRWLLDPAQVADDLAARGLLPDLSGWQVVFAGLGATAGAQLPLDEATYRLLVAYWTALCERAGAASCTVDASPAGAGPPASTTPVPLVPVPGVESVTAPDGRVSTTVTGDLLGFGGDSAEISATGRTVLAGVTAQITSAGAETVTVRGFAADPPGSTPEGVAAVAGARADAVVAALAAAGVPAVSLGGAVAPGPSAVRDGRFDETRAAQMRRVEITYGS